VTWNFDLEQAPRGTFKTVKCSNGKKDLERKIFVPEYIITACKDNKLVTVSCWLEPQKRWNGYATDESPIAWQRFPTHPEAA
jgi:hypothetical protein